MSCRSQPITTASSSVADGDVRQSIACWFSADAMKSASTPGALAVMEKYAMKPGWFQCVMPGIRMRSKSAMMASKASADSGADLGQRVANVTGRDARQHRELLRVLHEAGNPLDHRVAVLAELVWRHVAE